MSDRRTGVALVGTGDVANLYAKAFTELPEVHYLGGFNRTADKVHAFAERHGGKAYESLDELLADEAVEAVAVTTTKENHVAPTLACLEAGKHVLLEKPVASTIAEVRALKAAADKAGRVCMPAHNYIYAPALRRAKQHLDAGDYGKVSGMWMMFNIQVGEDWGHAYGPVVPELCIHHVYSTLHFLGRPSRVSAVGSNVHFETIDVADQTAIVCEFPSGAIANLWGCVAADDPTSDPWTVLYKILGTSGGFSFTWNESHFTHDKPIFGIAPYADSFLYELEYFVNECIAKGARPLSTLDDAIDSLSVLDAVQESLGGGGLVEVDYG